jgi:cobalt-zinc-cadmium efflux system membrane fusion protein
MKRAAFILALLAAGLACQGGKRPATDVPNDELWLEAAAFDRGTARVVDAREEELSQTVAAAGRVTFDDQRVAHIFSPVAGRITRVIASLGQRVDHGSALVAIASPEAGSALSDVVKAEADLSQTLAELKRQERLTELDAAPRRDLEAAQDAHRKADAELARARQRALLLRGAGIDDVTQELVLRSPIRGEVMARNASPGTDIQGASAGTPIELVTVGDIGRVWVIADVPEADLSRVQKGAAASLRVAAWPSRTFRATVELISPVLDPATRTARVRLSLDNADRALKPEMLAQVAIETAPHRGIAIPQRAITRIEGDAYVFVASGDTPDGRARFVRRRIRVEDGAPLVTVTSGLTAGERVLVEQQKGREAGGDEARLSERQLKEAGIQVVSAAEQELSDQIGLGGRTTFDDVRVAHVFSPVTGRVARVHAAPGQRVRKGDPLLTLVSPDVGTAFAEAVKAQADLVAVRHERDRQRELVAAHAGAPRDLEIAEANFRKASAEVARTTQKTKLLSAGTFDRVTQEYTLRSPIDGEVIARAAAPGLEVQGQWAGAGTPIELFTVGATDPLWILGDVYEMDLPHVHRGDDVTVNVPGMPGRVFRGRVDWVADVLDPALRTGKIRCVIPNPDRLLKPEMAPILSISLPARRHIAVPRQTVVRLGDETFVFVASGHAADGQLAFKRRRVIVGEDGPSGVVAVLDGLVAGEPVVVRGAIFLVGLL